MATTVSPVSASTPPVFSSSPLQKKGLLRSASVGVAEEGEEGCLRGSATTAATASMQMYNLCEI
jgi:hypothetical protein